jgi:hypothetical protein
MRFGIEEAIWLTASFSALHRCAFDSSLFAQRYPPPLDFVAFSRAMQELGLELQHSTRSLGGVLAWQLPVALLLEHEPSTGGPSPGAEIAVQRARARRQAKSARAEIVEGRRTVPEYLLSPVQRVSHEAAMER